MDHLGEIDQLEVVLEGMVTGAFLGPIQVEIAC
jgi:hypothetical protein